MTGAQSVRSKSKRSWAFDEVVAVAIAFAAFTLDSLLSFQVRWLVERNKAERLRIAKFRYLIDPWWTIDDRSALLAGGGVNAKRCATRVTVTMHDTPQSALPLGENPR